MSENKDLDVGLSALGEALASTSRGSPHRPYYLIGFANALLIRSRATGSLDDLAQGIELAKDAYNTLPPTAAERSIVATILGDALSRSYFQFFAGNDLEDALQALKKASEIGFSSEPPDFFSLERLLLDVHLARDVAAIYPGSEASFLDIVKHADNIVGGTDHENGIFRAVGAISAVIRERCVLKDVKDLLKEPNTALAHLHSTSLHFSGAGFVEFELAFARVVLQGVLWNQGADIELVITLSNHALENCFSSGDFRSFLTADGFDIAGDAYSLRKTGDKAANLQRAAKCYQSCIKRLSDRKSFFRNNALAKYSNVLAELSDRVGYNPWPRDTFCALEEILSALSTDDHVSAGTMTCRQGITAIRLFNFTRYCMWPASEFQGLVSRAFELSDYVLDSPGYLYPKADLALKEALDLFPWLGENILYRSWGKVASVQKGRASAQVYAFTRVRGNLLRAKNMLLQEVQRLPDRELALAYLLLSVVDFLLLHDGERLLLEESREYLKSGFARALTIQNTAANEAFRNLGKLLDELIDQLTRKTACAQDQNTRQAEEISTTARTDPAIKCGIPGSDVALWVVPLKFEARLEDGWTREKTAAQLEEGFEVAVACPNCGTMYEKRIWLYISEKANPNLFAQLGQDEFWISRCESCQTVMTLSYPLYVERQWEGNSLPVVSVPVANSQPAESVLVMCKPAFWSESHQCAPSTEYQAASLCTVFGYLMRHLPEPAQVRLTNALRVPSWALRVLVTVTDREADVARICACPIREILRSGDRNAIFDRVRGSQPPTADLPDSVVQVPSLCSRDPSSWRSCDGYDNRLDPLAYFSGQTEYREREFLDWLSAEDSEAILERRDWIATFAFTPDMRQFRDMMAAGWPLIALDMTKQYQNILMNYELMFFTNIANDEKESRHKEATDIVKNAVRGQGEYVLLLRTYSLEIPRVRGDEILLDSPYGLSKRDMMETIHHYGETVQDEVAAYIGGRFPVIGASDHIKSGHHPKECFAELRIKSTEWQDAISLLIEHAKYVIAFLGEFSASASWELDHLELLNATKKTEIFSFERFFIHIREPLFEPNPGMGTPIASPKWTEVFEDDSLRSRFAFVHKYYEDDDSWKACVDAQRSPAC